MTFVLLGIGIGLGIIVGAALILQPAPAKPLKTLRELDRLAVGNVLEGDTCKLQGTLCYDGTHTMSAPASGRTCVYFAVRIDVQQQGEPGGWLNVVRETGGCDFLLEDGAGVARVDVHGAQVTLVKDFVQFNVDELDSSFVEKHEGVLQAHAHELRVLEGILEAGETVAVSGYAMSEADPAAQATDYRAPAKRVVIRETDVVSLYISDDPSALRVRAT